MNAIIAIILMTLWTGVTFAFFSWWYNPGKKRSLVLEAIAILVDVAVYALLIGWGIAG